VAQAKADEIVRFLKAFKSIAMGRGVDFIPRREFMTTLAALGLTRANCQEELLGLSVEDYCQGPDEDRDRPGTVWVFGRNIEGKDIYIKLKLAQVGEEIIAKCLSFHPAEFPLCFPLKAEEGGKNK
jgi:hypothetical protein